RATWIARKRRFARSGRLASRKRWTDRPPSIVRRSLRPHRAPAARFSRLGIPSAPKGRTILSEAKEAGGDLFVLLPMEVLHDPTISHAAKLTYARLGFYAGRDGRCNPSHETLAAEVCLKSRQVRTVLNEL